MGLNCLLEFKGYSCTLKSTLNVLNMTIIWLNIYQTLLAYINESNKGRIR